MPRWMFETCRGTRPPPPVDRPAVNDSSDVVVAEVMKVKTWTERVKYGRDEFSVAMVKIATVEKGKLQPGVLIEPKPEYAIDPNDSNALAQFRNRIWPYIEEANKLGPAFARIFKELIMVTDPSKPLPRASKNTIQKKMALQAYSQEIENL